MASECQKVEVSPERPKCWRRVQYCVNALVILSFILCACFFICESGLRIYLMRFVDDNDTFRTSAPPELALDKEFHKGLFFRNVNGYREDLTPGYEAGANRHNSLGFRGEEIVMPKPPGEYRIACLGGSTTYDQGIDDWQKAYPKVLETIMRDRGFRVTVINAGVPGFTSRDSLLKFETVLLHLGVDMIVDYDGINDIVFRSLWPTEFFRSDYEPPPGFGVCLSFLEHSAVYRILRHNLWGERQGCTPDGRPCEYLLLKAFDQISEGVYPDGIFKTVSLNQPFESNGTTYFDSNLRSLIALANSRQITPVLMTFSLSAKLTPAEISPVVMKCNDEMNAVVRRIAQESGTLLFDLNRNMPPEGPYFVDLCHNSVEGARVKAGLIADFIVSKKGDTLPRL